MRSLAADPALLYVKPICSRDRTLSFARCRGRSVVKFMLLFGETYG